MVTLVAIKIDQIGSRGTGGKTIRLPRVSSLSPSSSSSSSSSSESGFRRSFGVSAIGIPVRGSSLILRTDLASRARIKRG